MSTPIIYMSRAFVEFGPFTLEEFHVFKNRGILKDTDYFRKEGESSWLHVLEFSEAHPLKQKSARSETKSDEAKTASPSASSSNAASKSKSSVATKGTSKKPTAKKTPKKGS